MGYYQFIKKNLVQLNCTKFNGDEAWKHYAKKRKLGPKGHIWFHIYEISGIGKSTETERRLVVVRGWGKGEWGVTTKWVEGFLWGWWKYFGSRQR